MSSEHRAKERIRTILAARLVFEKAAITVDCHVKDLSDSGARIMVAGSIPLPNEFTLEIPKRDMARKVRIAWRNADHVGLAFLVEEAPSTASSPEERIKQLEEENAALRAQVKKLRADLAMRIHMDESMGA